MPFASKAQAAFLHAHPEKVGGESVLKEWDSATHWSHLPKHVPKYHSGIDVVPQTGLAVLQRGEKVIPAKDNPMNPYEKITAGDQKPPKHIKEMVHTKSDNGKHIVTHRHHHPEHHRDETHVFDHLGDVHAHMEDHAGTPNAGEAPTGDNAPAPLTAAPPAAPGM